MSLRLQALIGAVALVAALTGGLLWTVAALYEDAERARIEGDLERDARHLRRALDLARDSMASRLEAELRTRELAGLCAAETPIKENFVPFAQEWQKAVKCDLALAAFDAMRATERQARALWKTRDLVVCALTPPRAGLAGPALDALLDDVYRSGRTGSAVLALARSVWLAVAAPMHEDLQGSSEAAGVAAVFFELSDRWAAEHRDPALRVHQVLYAGDAVTGQTLGDPAAAAQALHAMATSAGAEHLEARLAGERHLIRSEPLAASGVGFLALKSLDHELQPLHRLLRRVGLAAAVALVLGAAAAYGMAWLVIRRLQQLKQATLRVRSGDFETRVGMRGRDEVALLGQAFNDMVVGLKALGLYTDPALARHILDRSGLLGEQGLRTEGTVFFCDLEGFTSVAESLPAEELIRQLEEYFTLVGRVVAEEGGYLDKFIGDSVMAWWGPPFLEERDHAARALRAAWRCRAGAAELRERWAAEGRPPLRQRIGIATGEVIVGNLGSATKKNFTVIGDRVNVASRLEGANKRYGTEILVDGGTAESAGPGFQLREIDRIQVPGRQEAVQVFELVGVAEGAEARR